MHADAPRAQLPAVEDEVVGLTAHGGRVGREPVDVVGVGHGERVVGGDRVAVLVHTVEQREVDHPQVPVRALGHRAPAELEAQRPEHVAGQAVLVGHGQHQVTHTGAGGGHQAGLLLVGQELGHRRVDVGPAALALDHLEPRQALGAERLGPVGEPVEPRPGRRRPALEHDGLHAGGGEGPEARGREHGRQVDELHAEAVEGLGPRHAGHRTGPLAGDRLGGVEHGLGHESEDVLLVDEGCLDVELGELELAVGAQVLVAQAAGDLVVAVDAGHHQQLLGELRALGQHVAGAVVEPAGHGELPGALGRGRPQQRRLHLDEALPVHGRPQGPVDRGPEPQVGLHGGPPQVDEPVPEADDLVDVDAVVHRERRRLGGVQQPDRALAQLDLAGRQLRVAGPHGTEAYRALHGHDVLGPHVDRSRHHALDDSRVVADVEEGQVLTVLAALGHPAAHGHRPADVDRPQRAAQVGAHRRGPARRLGFGGNGHTGSFRVAPPERAVVVLSPVTGRPGRRRGGWPPAPRRPRRRTERSAGRRRRAGAGVTPYPRPPRPGPRPGPSGPRSGPPP